MAYCPSCFTVLDPKDKDCAKCGARFGPDSAWKPLAVLPFEDLQNAFFSLNGRISRSGFFGWVLLAHVAPLVAIYVSLFLDANNILIISVFAYFVLTIVSVFPVVRRMHDLDLSGWYAVFLFVPLLGAVLGLFLLMAPGTAGPNQFGPDPTEKPHSTRPQSGDSSETVIADSGSLESRLQRLAELKAKGLISEEVFAQKQRQILDAL